MPPIEIVAHRGASRERPENTGAAFQRALELGADGVELDVHLSADGTLFVHHDSVPHDVPNAALANLYIRSLTAEQLRAFRVRGEPMPTLEQVLRIVAGRMTAASLMKAVKEGEGTAKLKTVEGEDITVKDAGPGKLTITDAKGDVANVTIATVMQSNGVIHVIDTVLLPM